MSAMNEWWCKSVGGETELTCVLEALAALWLETQNTMIDGGEAEVGQDLGALCGLIHSATYRKLRISSS
jgi:hypothetical protein